ncbi:hypothetical protein K525DRAFT_215008 [Schizophyllum commune Loenen D]|nr:hypothetical protein K525DRAFT_215008 [Schizophyllum commune Loenen D]
MACRRRFTTDDQRLEHLRLAFVAIYGYILNTAIVAAILYCIPYYWKQPYHTLALTGYDWVRELIYGHPDCIRTALGMRLHVFITFVAELRTCGLSDTCYVTVEEQAAVFSCAGKLF